MAETVRCARNRGRRNRPTTGWESLTPSEEQVVVLVAEGLTNREIAPGCSSRSTTVKTTLPRLRQAGVANRTELAAVANRRKLTADPTHPSSPFFVTFAAHPTRTSQERDGREDEARRRGGGEVRG